MIELFREEGAWPPVAFAAVGGGVGGEGDDMFCEGGGACEEAARGRRVVPWVVGLRWLNRVGMIER